MFLLAHQGGHDQHGPPHPQNNLTMVFIICSAYYNCKLNKKYNYFWFPIISTFFQQTLHQDHLAAQTPGIVVRAKEVVAVC